MAANRRGLDERERRFARKGRTPKVSKEIFRLNNIVVNGKGR